MAIHYTAPYGLRISIMSEAGFEVKFNNYGTTGEILGYKITATTDAYAAVTLDSAGSYVVEVGSDKLATSFLYAEGGTQRIDSCGANIEDTLLQGAKPEALQVTAESPRDDDDDDPKGGPSGHQIDYNGTAALFVFKGVMACSSNRVRTCDCSDLCPFGNDDGDELIIAWPSTTISRRQTSRTKEGPNGNSRC